MSGGWGAASGAWVSGARVISGELAGASAQAAAPGSGLAASGLPERYELRGELGAGGMGRVSLAWDRVLRREVAIKVVRWETSDTLRARLQREAEVTAGLEHPSIVPVYDAGVREDGAPWYAMRVVRGRTLQEALDAEPDARGRQRWMRQVLAAVEAIAYAHLHGVLHRDLKPANILVGELGETQVMDWGLAVRIGEVEPAAHAEAISDARLTRVGAVVGSPAWMSPEAARGEPTTAASDVYSLGAVLHELLAGRPPHGGDSADAVLAAARAGWTPASLPPDTAPELAAILIKCLATDPAERYPNAAPLAADLAAWLDGRTVSAYRYRPRDLLVRLARAWRVPLLVAAGASVVLASVLAASAVRLRRESAATQAAANLAIARQAVVMGRASASAAEHGDRISAELMAIGALRLREDPDARGVLAGFGHQPRPRRVGSIAPVGGCAMGQVAPDAQAVACVHGAHLSVVDTRTGEVRWERDLVAGEVRYSEAGGLLWTKESHGSFSDGRFDHVGVDVATGAVRALVPMGNVSTAYDLGSDGVVFIHTAGVFLYEDLVFRRVQGCGEKLARSVFRFDGEVWAWCEEHAMVNLASGRVEGVAIDAPSDFAALSTGDLLVATRRNKVVVVDRATHAPVREILSPVGSLRRVVVGPGDIYALVGEDGLAVGHIDPSFSPKVVSTAAYGDAGWANGGRELIAAGERIDRFRVTARGGAHAHLGVAGLGAVAVDPVHPRVAAFGGGGAAWLWELEGGVVAPLPAPGQAVVKAAAFSADGARLLVGLADFGDGARSASLYDTADWALRPLDWGEPGALRAGALSDGRMWIRPYHRSFVALFAPSGGRVDVPSGGGGDMATFADGDGMASLDDQGVLTTWRPGEAQFSAVARIPGASTVAAALDGRLVVVSVDAEVLVVIDGALAGALEGASSRVLDLAISPDLRWVAAAEMNGEVAVWSLADRRLRMRARGHALRAAAVVFSVDAASLFSVSWDATARWWDLRALWADPAEEEAAARLAWGDDVADAVIGADAAPAP